jgi:nucleoid DNA-binding protein
MAAKKPLNQTQLLERLSNDTGMTRKEVKTVVTSLVDTISREIGARGPGVFMLPGILKIKVVVKAARPARKGINPFTKEPMVLKARPAKKVAKILPLSKLKAML